MIKNKLAAVNRIYSNGGNIIEYLKKYYNQTFNSKEMIEISYDIQSGSYIKNVRENPEHYDKYTDSIAKLINSLETPINSIIEVGVGEATTLGGVVSKLIAKPRKIFGLDISFSRIKYGQEYIKSKGIKGVLLFIADLFDIPIANKAIDIVYTSHSIEPNGGKEKEALTELMRITRKYLILLEPAYEYASEEGKKRMKKHGFITNLYQTAIDMELDVIEHRLFNISVNQLNPTGLIIIKTSNESVKANNSTLICPITKTKIVKHGNAYYSKDGFLIYPIIDKVPCLRKENAVIGTHFLDKYIGEVIT